MTNKEAIEQLKWVQKRISDITYSPESFEAINLAIKALELTESQRICCDNCDNCNIKSKKACTSPFGECALFNTTTEMKGDTE